MNWRILTYLVVTHNHKKARKLIKNFLKSYHKKDSRIYLSKNPKPIYKSTSIGHLWWKQYIIPFECITSDPSSYLLLLKELKNKVKFQEQTSKSKLIFEACIIPGAMTPFSEKDEDEMKFYMSCNFVLHSKELKNFYQELIEILIPKEIMFKTEPPVIPGKSKATFNSDIYAKDKSTLEKLTHTLETFTNQKGYTFKMDIPPQKHFIS